MSECNSSTRPQLRNRRKDSLSCTHNLTMKVQKLRIKSRSDNKLLMYGQGANKLAGDLRVDIDEARGLIRKFFGSFPKVTSYFDEAIANAKEAGYCTTILGRRRLLPGINSYFNSDVAADERKVKNSPIQGTAAEICKLAMIKLYEDDYIHDCGARMLVQVHDEVVFEVPKAVKDDPIFNKHIEDNMVDPLPFKLKVPLDIGSKYGENWLECK